MVEVCQIDSGDVLTNCVDAGVSGYQDMYVIAVGGSHAYIANTLAGSPSTIIHCSIGATGTFTGCAETGPADLEGSYGLTIHGSTLYISDSGAPRVRKCEIQPDGSLGACSDAGFPDALANAAEELRIVERMTGTTAYVLHYSEGRVSRCEVLADGSLSSCANAGVPGLDTPEGFTVTGNHMYIANAGANNVVRCMIAGDGSLSDCTDSGASGLAEPSQVAIRGSSAYIGNFDSGVGLTRCTVTSDGLLTGCTSTPGRTLSNLAIRL